MQENLTHHVWDEKTRDVQEDVVPSVAIDYQREAELAVMPDYHIGMSDEAKERARVACEKFQRGLKEGLERRIKEGQLVTPPDNWLPGCGKAGYNQAEGRELRRVPNAQPAYYTNLIPSLLDETVVMKRVESTDFSLIEKRIREYYEDHPEALEIARVQSQIAELHGFDYAEFSPVVGNAPRRSNSGCDVQQFPGPPENTD